jgi:hypothetical protein
VKSPQTNRLVQLDDRLLDIERLVARYSAEMRTLVRERRSVREERDRVVEYLQHIETLAGDSPPRRMVRYREKLPPSILATVAIVQSAGPQGITVMEAMRKLELGEQATRLRLSRACNFGVIHRDENVRGRYLADDPPVGT